MANRIITINRMYGSNGRKLGKALAKELGIHYYDRELIQIASEKEGIPYEELLKVDEKRASQWRYPLEDPIQMAPQYRFYPMNDMLFQSECEIIRSIAEKEDCIIIGRCGNYVLQDQLDDVIRIFVYADTVTRVRRIMDVDKVDEEEALRRMRKIDKERTEYHKYFTGRNWMDMENYDLPINASRIDYDEMIILIKDYLKLRGMID